ILPRSTTQWATRQKQIRSGNELQKSAGKPKVNLCRRNPALRLVQPEIVHQTPSYCLLRITWRVNSLSSVASSLSEGPMPGTRFVFPVPRGWTQSCSVAERYHLLLLDGGRPSQYRA